MAERNLGFMYHNGQGVLKDYIQAYMWFNLAAAGGDNRSHPIPRPPRTYDDGRTDRRGSTANCRMAGRSLPEAVAGRRSYTIARDTIRVDCLSGKRHFDPPRYFRYAAIQSSAISSCACSMGMCPAQTSTCRKFSSLSFTAAFHGCGVVTLGPKVFPHVGSSEFERNQVVNLIVARFGSMPYST